MKKNKGLDSDLKEELQRIIHDKREGKTVEDFDSETKKKYERILKKFRDEMGEENLWRMDSETSKEWDRISEKIDDELGEKNFSFKELDSEIKNKITRLAKFLDEFLEKNFSFEEVYKKKHEELIKCIEDNLFASAMPFLVDFSPNPDLAEKYKHLQNDGDIYAFAKTCTILSIHELLRKGIWDNLKEQIYYFQIYLESQNVILLDENFILKYLKNIKINYDLNLSEIHFYPTILDSIRAFQNLLEGVPTDCFRKCKGCSRFFVITNGHNRKFCDGNCAARYHQRKEREKDRKEFNKYHNDYYYDKKNGIKRKKGKKEKET